VPVLLQHLIRLEPGAFALRLTAGQIAQHRPGGNRETTEKRKMKTKIQVNTYTGRFEAAICPAVDLSRIRTVAIYDAPDAREMDDLTRALAAQGRAVGQWVRRLPRLRMDIYEICSARE